MADQRMTGALIPLGNAVQATKTSLAAQQTIHENLVQAFKASKDIPFAVLDDAMEDLAREGKRMQEAALQARREIAELITKAGL